MDAVEHLALAGWHVARLLRRRPGLRHLEDDLLQQARLGVLLASRRHDPARGRFSTLAAYCMRREVTDLLRREGFAPTRHGKFRPRPVPLPQGLAQ